MKWLEINLKNHLIKNNIQNVRGRQKKYHYLTTVKSIKELDKFRFKVNAKKSFENQIIYLELL
jgi:hypothetical protein